MRAITLSKISLITLCLGPGAGHLYAQNAASRIDSLVTTLNERNELSGNVLVAAGGTEVYRHSSGYANVAAKKRNNDSTTFLLASLAKPFTATAILQLKEKGRLRLDDAVVRYLPGFPYPAITIRQLLAHTSGLVDLQIFEAPYKADTNKIFSNADIIPAIKGEKNALLGQPGEKYSYSNTGYGLLVLIVEKVSGLHFPDYLQKNVFAPSGMRHTYVRSRLIDQNPRDPERNQNYDPLNYAPGRLLVADSLKRYKIALINLGGILGPDGIVSTSADLLRFDQALYGSKLLRPATLQEAFTPVKLNNGQMAAGGGGKLSWYSGLGWMILRDTSMGKVVFHPGGDIGAVTILLRNINKRQTVILLDNVTHRGVHNIGVDILDLLNDKTIQTDKRSLAKIYVSALFEKGTDAGVSRFNSFKGDTAHYYINERELNDLGYDLLRDGHRTEAVEALRLTTLLYPGSWNAYDSYAEVLLLAGKKEEAITMYQLSVKLNPKNESAKKVLKQLAGKK
jgi:CubicO group peptidase (beta-lactamase class C family)